jgi:hypothetical protein
MAKHEIKVEFSNSSELKEIIEKSYFEEGFSGKIMGKKNFIVVDEEKNESTFSVIKGLNNATIKITNSEIIDGTMRFLIEETDEIRIYPISTYCIKEDEKYIFF